MKRSKLFFLVVCVLLILGGSFYFLPKGVYYSVPIIFNPEGLPMIAASVNGREHLLHVVIGARFPLYLNAQVVEELGDLATHSYSYQDSDGQEHTLPSRLIPKIEFGNTVTKNLVAVEGMPDESNSIGMMLGEGSNLFLNFPQSKIIACDNFAKLQKKLDVKYDWIACPFDYFRGYIIFKVDTDFGSYQFCLWTGINQTVLRHNLIDKNGQKTMSFVMGGEEFGTMEILPWMLPKEGAHRIDGWLGMDFLKKHAIYLDIKSQVAYISAPEKYFQHFPVSYNHRASPTIEALIEDTVYPIELDTGSGFFLDLHSDILAKMHKTRYGSASWEDYKGNCYDTTTYTIPNMHLGDLQFTNCLVNAIREDFHENVSTAIDRQPIAVMGRRILEHYNLLLDFSKNSIYACRSYRELQKRGFLSQNLLQVPFEHHANGIVLSVDTDFGIKKLLLDTGSSHVVISNADKEESSRFCLNGYDFGPQSILCLEITPQFDVDGFLGMEFIRNHALFIDYPKKHIYIDLNRLNSSQKTVAANVKAL